MKKILDMARNMGDLGALTCTQKDWSFHFFKILRTGTAVPFKTGPFWSSPQSWSSPGTGPSNTSSSTIPVCEAAVYASTITTQQANNSWINPTPINVSASTTSTSKSTGKKWVHMMVFPNESNASLLPSSPLFSIPCHPTEPSPSAPSSMQGASKCSQKSALQTQEEEQCAQMITINTVQSTISNLHDILAIIFQNELTVVHDTTRALYLIPSFAANKEKIFMLREFFADKANVSLASIFLSLKEKDHVEYAKWLYTQHCAPDSSSASPSML